MRTGEIMLPIVEVAIVGAGPYGLSLAAHLRAYGMPYRIFGPAMQTWAEHMPEGMLLKSDGFASSLSDPVSAFPLQEYCRLQNLPYHPTRLPVRLDTFVNYGREFQRRYVPELDPREVLHIDAVGGTFRLEFEDGEEVLARRVVMAVGISYFAHLPQEFQQLPATLVSHSSQHKSPARWKGRSVAVLGAGASAIDLAALLEEAGANVCILTRRPALVFHRPPGAGARSLWQRLRYPHSGLGLGWPSRFYSDFPGLFHHLPETLRQHIVRTHLGPSAGWPMRERILGKFPVHSGLRALTARPAAGSLELTWQDAEGQHTAEVDQLIAATGYRPDVDRLSLLSPALRCRIARIAASPLLSAEFESSIPGLYFTGIAAALSFGPVMRFAYGAAFTADRLARHLQATARRATATVPPADSPAALPQEQEEWEEQLESTAGD
jgi:cation diffusion facilitator CzcD-associated flavoprotein CzcO